MKIFRKIFLFLMMTCILSGSFLLNVQALSEDEITAPSAVLMDAQTGKVLYEKNAHEVRTCASITKVMTLDLVMEALESKKINWTDTVTASAHAASMGGSDIWLEPGETMTVDEMVKATIVASANDAAVALAEFVCGTEDEFVSKMNEKAKTLGMKETVFKNCNGLDEDGHVTSAYDVALMSRDLLKHQEILNYSKIWMDYLRNGKTQLVNTNKLLKTYQGITGLKTGTTSQAGSCISATAERDGLSLIAVVLGSASGKDRFSDASKLLDYGFANYAMYLPEVPEGAEVMIPVKNGLLSEVKTKAEINTSFLIQKGKGAEIKPEIIIPQELTAPVKKGESIGKIVYKNGSDKIAEYPVTAVSDIQEIQLWDIFSMLWKNLVGI